MSYTRDDSGGSHDRAPGQAARGRPAGGLRRTGPPLGLALALAVAAPAFGQSGGVLTLAQVERRYPDMNVIHIEKCDKGDDGLYDRGELACVASIYDVMYRSR